MVLFFVFFGGGGKEVVGSRVPDALQDLCRSQPALLVGIIAMMTGSVQQEDIAASARSFLARGADILRMGRGECAVPEI